MAGEIQDAVTVPWQRHDSKSEAEQNGSVAGMFCSMASLLKYLCFKWKKAGVSDGHRL